jgi:hypothetical protein
MHAIIVAWSKVSAAVIPEDEVGAMPSLAALYGVAEPKAWHKKKKRDS